MDIAFATAQVDQADRLTAWRELVNQVFLPLAITPLPATGRAAEFGASVTGSDRGELRVWRVTATPMWAVRTVHHIESSARDDYLLALHISGTATGAQDDRQLSLGPGDFALFGPTRPYAIAFRGTDTFEHVIYQVPRASIDARWPAGNLTALGVPAASSAGRLTSPYLQTLARTAGPSGDRPAQAFIDAALDLAVSALRAAAGTSSRLDPHRNSLIAELKRYALAHLGDQDLSPATAARASFISVRQPTGSSRTRVSASAPGSASNDCAAAETTSPASSSPTAPSPKSPPAGASAAPRTSPAPSAHATAPRPPSSAAMRHREIPGDHQERFRTGGRLAAPRGRPAGCSR